MTVLYHICRPEDETLLHQGYIGISDNFEQRLDRHSRGYSGSPILSRAFDKYPELSYSIVAEGTREEMLALEADLRPSPMGWNATAGGGSPPNLSGKVMSQEQKDKISKTNRKVCQNRSGATWTCDGIEFPSKLEASEYFGVTRKTIKDRCDNPKFVDWFKGRK